MPIQVTCPGCLSRFTVSEKFAGKVGPCPKCKKEIKIPDASQEVVIHAPEPTSGPKNSQGTAVFKPIGREYVSLSRNAWIGIALGVIAVFLAAIAIRVTSAGSPNPILVSLGALLIAPPLIIAGYGFLRDTELGGYTGKELMVRTAISSVVFAITWGIYVFLSHYFENKTVAETPVLQMVILVAIMVVIGTLTSLGAFELEVGQAALHYMLYFAITFVLSVIMGIAIGEPLAGLVGKGGETAPKPVKKQPANTPANTPTKPAKTTSLPSLQTIPSRVG